LPARLPARLLPLVALLACAGCGDEDAPVSMAGGFRIPVTWERVESGEVVETVELVGDVLSRRWARLAFERPGRVVEVLADLGDRVATGHVLARLDDDVIARDLDVARTLVDSARVDAEFTGREARRGADAGVDVLSASEQDRRVAQAATAAAHLAQREAEVLRLQAVLEQGRLQAPFDGVVAAREITVGSYAATGQPAFTLVDLDHREVHLEIPAPVATRMTLGGPVELRVDDLPDLVVTGTMDELVPTASLSSRTFTGVVRLDGLAGAEHLLPGMFTRARFAQASAESRTVVPADAVLEDGLGARIVVMDVPAAGLGPAEDGGPPAPTARIVPVRVLASDGARAAVQAGEPGALQPGARVIVSGADNVFPGAQLAPVPPLDAAGGPGDPGDPGDPPHPGDPGRSDGSDGSDVRGAPGAPGESGESGGAGTH
jgi:RND family efflux transporter MFP subunit